MHSVKKALGLIAALGIIGGITSAQDAPRVEYVYDTPVELTSLALVAQVPADWLLLDANGYTFVTNQSDLDAVSDTDETTVTTGVSLFMTSLSYSQLELEATATNEDIATALGLASVIDAQEIVDIGLLGYQVTVYLGTGIDTNRDSLFAYYGDGTNMTAVIMTLAEGESYLSYAFTFGNFLGLLRPIGSADLTQSFDDANTGLTVVLPEGTDLVPRDGETISRAYSVPADEELFIQGGGDLAGIVYMQEALPYELVQTALGLDAKPEATDLIAALNNTMEDPQYMGNFLVNDIKGFGLSGALTFEGQENLRQLIVVTFDDEKEQVVNYYLIANGDEAFTGAIPTFLTVLNFVTTTE